MAMNFLKNIFGTNSDREIKKLDSIVSEINVIYESLKNKMFVYYIDNDFP